MFSVDGTLWCVAQTQVKSYANMQVLAFTSNHVMLIQLTLKATTQTAIYKLNNCELTQITSPMQSVACSDKF